MAEFYLYLDESGKLQTSDYTSLCGFVTHDAEFGRIGLEWNNLRLAWGVPPIHMRLITDPDRDKSGEWQKIRDAWGARWEDKREQMLKEFATLIHHSSAACIGSVVDAAYFKQLPASPFKRQMKDPLFMSFHYCLMTGLDKLDSLSDEHHLGLVMDDDPHYSKDCYDVLTALKDVFPEVKRRVDSICFANDKGVPALQAADMVAYEARRFMVERMANDAAAPSFLLAALTRDGLHNPKLYTPQILDHLQRNIREVAASS